MITGLQFPPELETNKDLYVYRKYLNEKRQEPKSSLLPFIPATAIGAGLGYVIGKRGAGKPLEGLLAGASIPALVGYGLKRYDDTQIDRAKDLSNLSDDELLTYLTGKQQRIQERPPQLQKLMKIQNIFAKTASGNEMKVTKTLGKVLIGAVAGAGLLTGAAVMVSKANNPEKWEKQDPVTAWKSKPKIMVR